MSIITYHIDEIDRLTDRIVSLVNNHGHRIIIGITGIPGSGKTTLSGQLSTTLNAMTIPTKVISQDGYHLYRKELQELPNSDEAIKRRGSPFTFNSSKFLTLVKHLNDEQFKHQPIRAPSFDHKVKDPVEDDVIIDTDTKVIIIEGNYLSLKDDIWNQLNQYIDEIWFLQVPLDLARKRLIKRHLDSGISEDEDEARDRVENNDLVNGEYILNNSIEPKIKIITEH